LPPVFTPAAGRTVWTGILASTDAHAFADRFIDALEAF
jgi:hypothetical protein